ncbi:hypothetical protein QFZ41_001438 [Luteibacter sp. W1I16]
MQQFRRAGDDRERRAQLVAHVGIEFAIALDHRGQPHGVFVQRDGQLTHLVVGKMGSQGLGLAHAPEVAQAARQVGHRPQHARRQPHAQNQREQAEQEDRGDHAGDQLALAQLIARDVELQEVDDAAFAPHRHLVVVVLPVLVRLVEVVHAGTERLPVQRRLVDRAIAERGALDDVELRPFLGIRAHFLVQRIDLVLEGRVDQLLFDALTDVDRGEREQRAQAEPEQRERDDQAETKLTSGPHPDRPCGIRYRDACGSEALS